MENARAFALTLLILPALASPLSAAASREEMLAYYQSTVEPQIPKTVKTLLGDERINIEVGGRTIGIVTKRGEISGFDLKPLENQSIEVRISDSAVANIMGGKAGILQSINDGGITIRTHGLYTTIKVEVMKRIYSVSGADDILTGKRKAPDWPAFASSIHIQRARIAG